MRHTLIALIATLIAGCSPTIQQVSPLPSPIYFPHVIGRTIPTVTPIPPCYQSPQASQFATLVVTDSRQQRDRLFCHPALVQAAQARAESLAREGAWSHCDKSGKCANTYAREAGCKLPAHYGDGNNIESLVGGTFNVAVLYDALLRSARHRTHVFGENDFFRQQYHIGAAYIDAPGSRFRYYMVLMIGICE